MTMLLKTPVNNSTLLQVISRLGHCGSLYYKLPMTNFLYRIQKIRFFYPNYDPNAGSRDSVFY